MPCGWPGLVDRMGFVGKMGMTELFAQFTVDDFTVFICGYQVILGTSKALADGIPIICN